MPASSPHQPPPSATKPVPAPTHPVAGQPVESDSPEFDWTVVPNAQRYRLQIASTDAFEAIHYDEVVEPGTKIRLEEVLPSHVTTASWRVRAEMEEGTSPWSKAAHFARSGAEEAQEGALVVDAPPVPVHPTREANVNRSATSFEWKSIPEASGYQIQVARTGAFSDLSVDLTLDQTTSITLYKALPQETQTLYWRVRSLFPHATAGPWCDPVPFELSPAPAPEKERDPKKAAEEASSPEESPTATGWVRESRTTSTMSLTVTVLAIVSFLLTILLIALLG